MREDTNRKQTQTHANKHTTHLQGLQFLDVHTLVDVVSVSVQPFLVDDVQRPNEHQQSHQGSSNATKHPEPVSQS